MKKKYNKPVIVFEDFSLSMSIAGDCEEHISPAAAGTCGLDFGGDKIFVGGVSLCTTEMENMVDTAWGDYNGACYHNPSDTNNIFMS